MEKRVVSFAHMKKGTKEDFEIIAENDRRTDQQLPERILNNLQQMAADDGAYHINRLEHSLQAATRAEREGADDEWIVAALIHDIGDTLAPHTHADVAYHIIRPFVREEVAWTVKHHGIFQMHYNKSLTEDLRNLRDTLKDHEFYDSALHFVENWDQCAFDPDYQWFDLEHFRPVVSRVFSTRRYF